MNMVRARISISPLATSVPLDYPGDLLLGDALHYIGGILEFSLMKLSLAGFQPTPFIYRVSSYPDLSDQS